VWTTLQRWEHSKVDGINVLLTCQNHTRSWTSQTLVGRCRDDITEFKWLVQQFGCNETASVRNIGHQKRANRVRYFPKLLVIVVGWIRTSSANNHLWFELEHLFGKSLIIDQTIFFFNVVWLTFKIDAGCGNLFGLSLMTMRQVASVSERQSHDFITWFQQGSVNSEVSWRS